MLKLDIFQNRKIIGEKICAQIRRDGGRLVNAKFFKTRPTTTAQKNTSSARRIF
ncbi:MAG: hypothetical protein J5809_01040 [Selenomonadaceae bacterium]|nr:hypothetical protein [Selenomonadaceae bacterium]